MGNLEVEERKVVVPGEIIATGMDFIPAQGCYRDDDKVIANKVGLMNLSGRLIKVIPLNSYYMPKKNDTIIGRVNEVTYSNWFIDVGYAYEGSLNLRDASNEYIERGAELTDFYAPGDYVLCKITQVTKQNAIDLTMKGPGLRKLHGGRVIEISPAKVPRVVGKQGSMINQIKDATGCLIIVGQNGRVFVAGKDPEMERKAVETIEFINENGHLSGMTERVKKRLESK